MQAGIRRRRAPTTLLGAALAALALGAGVGLVGTAAADDAPADVAPGAPAASAAPVDPGTVTPAPVEPGVPTVPLVPLVPVTPGLTPEGSAAQQGGGASRPARKPIDEQIKKGSDAAPSVVPGFVDAYAAKWRAVEDDRLEVQTLQADLAQAQVAYQAARSDLGIAERSSSQAQAALSGAEGQYSTAVRGLYIAGSSDVDLVLGVLGSKPDDVLRNIDSFQYLQAATGSEGNAYEQAQRWADVVDSAATMARINVDESRRAVTKTSRALDKAKDRLASDTEELQRLVASAAPQTIVGTDGCPKAVLEGTVPAGVNVHDLCKYAVKHAPSPQAASAIKFALVRLGAPYACEGIGRMEPWRFDCSSYVSRAYAEGAGLRTAGDGWAPSTRNMVPWDGVSLDPHYAPIDVEQLKPGDLVLYDTCPAGETCPYRHVQMYLGPVGKGGVPLVAHTNACGSVAHVSVFEGATANFLGARRVMALKGEKVDVTFEKPGRKAAPAAAGNPAGRPGSGRNTG